MNSTIYIDLVFLSNLSMDFLTLLLVKICLKRYGPPVRLLAAAAAGALWACPALLWSINRPPGVLGIILGLVSGIPGTAVMAAVMAWIAFERKTGVCPRLFFKRILQDTAGIFLGAAILGGVWEGAENLFAASFSAWEESGGFPSGEPRGGGALSAAAFAAMAAGTFSAGRYLWLTAAETGRKRRYLCRVKLAFQGRETETEALLDTGNHLTSPDGKRPVHVLEYEVCRTICSRVDRVCYIPYRSVGRQDGVIPAVTLDYMEIMRGEERRREERPLVGIVKQSLSPDGSYHMLLNEKAENE